MIRRGDEGLCPFVLLAALFEYNRAVCCTIAHSTLSSTFLSLEGRSRMAFPMRSCDQANVQIWQFAYDTHRNCHLPLQTRPHACATLRGNSDGVVQESTDLIRRPLCPVLQVFLLLLLANSHKHRHDANIISHHLCFSADAPISDHTYKYQHVCLDVRNLSSHYSMCCDPLMLAKNQAPKQRQCPEGSCHPLPKHSTLHSTLVLPCHRTGAHCCPPL